MERVGEAGGARGPDSVRPRVSRPLKARLRRGDLHGSFGSQGNAHCAAVFEICTICAHLHLWNPAWKRRLRRFKLKIFGNHYVDNLLGKCLTTVCQIVSKLYKIMLANFGRRPARDSCEPEVEAAQGVVRAQGEGQALGAGRCEQSSWTLGYIAGCGKL